MKFILHLWLIQTLSSWIILEQGRVIEYLRTENQVLREKLGKGRILSNDDQLRRLAVKGRILGRKALSEIATKDERAELFVGPFGDGLNNSERHLIGFMISATSFLNAESLLLLPRLELLHIADMRDPALGYTRASLLADDGHIRNTLL